MTYTKLRAGALTAVALTAIAVACTKDSVDVLSPTPAANPIFQRYVALGNSITAGYQSSGINDSTQRESYARLVAQQMHTGYTYPSLVGPGCPPPVVNFLTQARLGGGTSTTCLLRDPATTLLIQNNVAVPGATSADPTAATTKASNILTQLFLGGKTQVQRALDAQPTFISAWVGNNDVLDAATKGVAVVTTALNTAGITDTTTFRANYKRMVDQLTVQKGLKGILIGVVNVTAIPALFPAESLLTNPTFKAKFDAIAGATTTVLANCPGSHALISYGLAGQIRAGTFPAVVSCQKNVPAAPVGDWFVLDSTEQRIFNTDIARYNSYIANKADSAGFAYLDPNPLLYALRQSGAVPTLPDFTNPVAPFGTYISLDGAHPSGKTHCLAANAVITAINLKYQTTLSTLTIDANGRCGA
ncbi:MAG: SGNH/GDSL hydrolase family protein [Gemmatimonadaceae bacterium]